MTAQSLLDNQSAEILALVAKLSILELAVIAPMVAQNLCDRLVDQQTGDPTVSTTPAPEVEVTVEPETETAANISTPTVDTGDKAAKYIARYTSRAKFFRENPNTSFNEMLAAAGTLTGRHCFGDKVFKYEVTEGYFKENGDWYESWKEVDGEGRTGYQYARANRSGFSGFSSYKKGGPAGHGITWNSLGVPVGPVRNQASASRA